MKLIYPDLISSISATEEDLDYPIENVQDNYPKNVWKATSRDASITITPSAAANAVAIFATNAETIGCTVGGVAVPGSPFTPALNRLWIDYAGSSGNVVLSLTSPAGTIAEAGVIRCGAVTEFEEPDFGIRLGLVDHSIEDQLNNGSFYYLKRDILYAFSGEVWTELEVDFYTFFRDCARAFGKTPQAWRITDISNQDWAVFGRFSDLPVGLLQSPNDVPITFSIVEVP